MNRLSKSVFQRALVAMVVAFWASPAAAQFADVRASLERKLDAQNVPSLAVAVANRRPYNLRLEVRKRGDVLNGSLIALSLPGNRAGNALTHWIELRQESSR